jgi:hypothetical protein
MAEIKTSEEVSFENLAPRHVAGEWCELSLSDMVKMSQMRDLFPLSKGRNSLDSSPTQPILHLQSVLKVASHP